MDRRPETRRRGRESKFRRFIVDINSETLRSARSWIFRARSGPVGRLSWAVLHLPSQSSKPKVNDHSIALGVLSLYEVSSTIFFCLFSLWCYFGTYNARHDGPSRYGFTLILVWSADSFFFLCSSALAAHTVKHVETKFSDIINL